MKTISIDRLSDTLEEQLTLYHEDIVVEVKKQTQKTMREMVKETKQQKYIQDTGEYRNAISSKKVEENINGLIMAWYVKPPHYRLSHLLEFGHATANGGRTVAYGTIGKAETKAVGSYLKAVEGILK